jgi:uncharacterized coiled-coil protein SlyX
MRESHGIPGPSPQQALDDSELDDLRSTRWRQAQEIDTLNETIAVYRQGATALADQIARLRDELAVARSLHTRTCARGAHQEVEITLAADEDAPEVVALAVGEALADSTPDAWQTIASDLTDGALHRYGTSDDVMLRLRIKRSDTAAGIEIIAA